MCQFYDEYSYACGCRRNDLTAERKASRALHVCSNASQTGKVCSIQDIVTPAWDHSPIGASIHLDPFDRCPLAFAEFVQPYYNYLSRFGAEEKIRTECWIYLDRFSQELREMEGQKDDHGQFRRNVAMVYGLGYTEYEGLRGVPPAEIDRAHVPEMHQVNGGWTLVKLRAPKTWIPFRRATAADIARGKSSGEWVEGFTEDEWTASYELRDPGEQAKGHLIPLKENGWPWREGVGRELSSLGQALLAANAGSYSLGKGV